MEEYLFESHSENFLFLRCFSSKVGSVFFQKYCMSLELNLILKTFIFRFFYERSWVNYYPEVLFGGVPVESHTKNINFQILFQQSCESFCLGVM